MPFVIESLSSTDPSSCRSHGSQDTGLRTHTVNTYQFMVSYKWWNQTHYIEYLQFLDGLRSVTFPELMIRHFDETFSGVCGRFHGPFTSHLTIVHRPYYANCFTWTFARHNSVISVVHLKKVPFQAVSDCVRIVFANSLCILTHLQLDYCGFKWFYGYPMTQMVFWGLFEHLGVFGRMF